MNALWRCQPLNLPLDARNIASGIKYKPTLYAGYDNLSGTAESVPGRLNLRPYEFLSQLEMKFFHLAHLNPYVCDIREQYPACSDEVFAKFFADPDYRPSKQEVPSIDFVLTLLPKENDGPYRYVGINVKPSSKLSEGATVRRLLRERAFCEQLGWSWYLVTERNIPEVAAENARRIYYWMKGDDLSPSVSDAERLGRWLLSNSERSSLFDLLNQGSLRLSLPADIMPHLFATACYLGLVEPDMRKRLGLHDTLWLKQSSVNID